jgi:predicted TIM-barrel fold metal-dependent hydrolase
LRDRVKNGEIKVFAELSPQYLGIAPDDAKLEPYYALAEELDVPVGIHLGIGPPAVAYLNRPGFPPVKSPNYRGAAGSPLLLEDVLIRHPKLRIYAMHAAYPFRDEMIYMLYMHPQLYVDISVLQWAIPRAAYYRYLRELVEAGFAKRIMFGSDGGPDKLKDGVDAVMKADFLTAEQKSDILYNNAARFFKLN